MRLATDTYSMRLTLDPSYLRFTLISFVIAIGCNLVVQPSHAEEEQRLFGLIDLLNGVKEKICSDEAPEALTKSSVPKPSQIEKQNSVPLSTGSQFQEFKSEADLRRYLECYVVEPGRWNVVERTYLPLIKSAAISFDIPETLLACLIFRESRFDINARSSSGAIGLGQHLKGTMTHITNILKPIKQEAVEEHLETSKMSLKDQMKAKKRSAGEASKSLAYARTKLNDREFRLKWEEYFRNLESRKLHRGNTPRVVSTGNIQDPKIAIGATAMYLRMIISHFKKTLDQDLRIDQSDENGPNYYVNLAAAGAYNMGYGAAQKILNPIEPPDRKKWVDALAKSNEETAAHILSIKNCIRAPSSKEGSAWNGPIGSDSYACEDRDEADKRKVLGKNPLPKEYRSNVKSATLKRSAPPKKPTNQKKSGRPAVKSPPKPAVKPEVKAPAKPVTKPAPVKK